MAAFWYCWCLVVSPPLVNSSSPSVVDRKSLHWLRCSACRAALLARTKPQLWHRTCAHCWGVSEKAANLQADGGWTYLMKKTVVDELIKVFAHIHRRSYSLHGGGQTWRWDKERISKTFWVAEKPSASSVVGIPRSQFLTVPCRPPRGVFRTLL